MGLHLRDPWSAVLVLRGMERRTRGSAASVHERFPKWHSDFAPDLCDVGNVTAPRTRSISATSFCRGTGAPLGKRLAGLSIAPTSAVFTTRRAAAMPSVR